VVDGAGAARSMRADIAEGVRFVWRNAVLRTLALMLGATNLGWTAYYAVFVLYAVRPGPMGLSKAGYGAFVTVGAVGGLVGAWLGPRVERALGRARALLLAVTIFGAALAVPAITASVVLNAVAFGMAGLWSVVWNVITVSLRQRITPDHLLGRMNSTYRLLGWGTMPIGAALGGAIAEWVGLRATFAVAALVHLPLLLGFLVVTERRIVEAESDYTSNLSA
jgi:MFS family permease